MSKGDHAGYAGRGPGSGRRTGIHQGDKSYSDLGGFRKGKRKGAGYGRKQNLTNTAVNPDSRSYRVHTLENEDEIILLKSQAASLRLFLENIERKLNELEKKNDQ